LRDRSGLLESFSFNVHSLDADLLAEPRAAADRSGTGDDRARAAETQAGVVHEDSAGASRLQAIIDQHFAATWRFLRRLGIPEHDVDDAMQDVILIVARKIDVIHPGSERGFLLSTAFRVARATRRARQRRGERDLAILRSTTDERVGIEELAELHRARELLDAILEDIPLDARAVFVLYEIEDMTTGEIAEVLGLPGGTVASRLRRARSLFDAAVRRLESNRRWRER
jgi:RNA polymerase sigma-70 factor (ECF subfamily)